MRRTVVLVPGVGLCGAEMYPLRICLHESHSTLLVSRRAARSVVRFLSEGQFEKDER